MRTVLPTKNLRGFTLVELLVVIGIISVLVAITAPYLTSSMTKARTAQCAGNLRTIGVGLLAFAADNDGNFPQAGAVIPYNKATDGSGQYGWTQQAEGYMGGKGLAVYKCPDSSRFFSQNATYSYFIGAHAAFVENHGSFGPVNLMKMRAPSQHILAGDIAFNMFSANDADKDDYTQDPAFNGNSRIRIHGGGSNILFADGHIEYLHSFDKNTMTTRYDGPGFEYLK